MHLTHHPARPTFRGTGTLHIVLHELPARGDRLSPTARSARAVAALFALLLLAGPSAGASPLSHPASHAGASRDASEKPFPSRKP